MPSGLSDRLEAVLARVPAAPRLIDVGTDHAWLPIEAVRRRRVERAIAVDRCAPPLAQAAANVRQAGLEARIACVLSDGLKQVDVEVGDALSICGMGGRSLLAILTARPQKLACISRLVLQPHYHAEQVREWAYERGWHLADEALVEEPGRFYPLLCYLPGQGPDPAYRPGEFSLSELFRLGPLLLSSGDAAARAYYRAQGDRLAGLGRLAEAEPWSRAGR